MISLSMLTVLGLVLLKLSLNILAPRQWMLRQTLTDAYMSYERALAERVPFETLLAASGNSNLTPDQVPCWPIFPDISTVTNVTIGRLPGGTPITGTVVRTRIADPRNNIVDGGAGDEATNPAAMKVWKAQSVLTYTIGSNTYAKSRTVLRSQ